MTGRRSSSVFYVFNPRGATVTDVVRSGPWRYRGVAEKHALRGDEIVETDEFAARRIDRHLTEERQLRETLRTGLGRTARGERRAG